jgi:hypothetical protein
MGIYFSNCKFYEIQLQIKVFPKYTIRGATNVKQVQIFFLGGGGGKGRGSSGVLSQGFMLKSCLQHLFAFWLRWRSAANFSAQVSLELQSVQISTPEYLGGLQV